MQLVVYFRNYSTFNSYLIRKHRDEDVDNEAKNSLLILLNTGRIDSTIDQGIATPAGAIGSVDIDGQMCNHDSSHNFDDEAWTETGMEFEENCAESIGYAYK